MSMTFACRTRCTSLSCDRCTRTRASGGIDTSEALKAPGVVAVYTGKDIATKVGPVPCAAALPDLKVPDYRVLATGKALFVGHPIAAVVATDKYAARDAVDLCWLSTTKNYRRSSMFDGAAARRPGDSRTLRRQHRVQADFRRRRHRRRNESRRHASSLRRWFTSGWPQSPWSRAACWLGIFPARKN